MQRLLASLLLVLAVLAGPLRATAVDGFEVTVVVEKGDSLSRIARRNKVSVRQIKKWNGLRSNAIRPGQQLTVYSPVPKRPTRIILHKVARGDTLWKLAKKYGTSVATLKRLNGVHARRLRRGHDLKVEVPGPENPSKAVGSPRHGRLLNGEQLPQGPGYVVVKPGLAWATNRVVTHLMMTLPQVRRKWGKQAPDVIVGDLSRKEGGSFPPHRSHENGLDVDIGFYHKVKRAEDHPTGFRRATPETLDVPKTWFLIEALLDTGHVEYIFIDRSLHSVLKKYAEKKGKPRKAKKQWLQEVFGQNALTGIIRHSKSHQNHIHVRFEPAPEDDSPGKKQEPDLP